VDVDSSNSIILSGASFSNDFPISDSAYQDDMRGLGDVVVTKMSPDGQTLNFSTFLGGTRFDMGTGVDVDSEGNIVITGETSSLFPVLQAYQQNRGHTLGESECFVSKFNATGSLVFSTYLAGSGESMGYDAVFDGNGNIIVVGEASSTSFPVVNPYQENHGGDGVGLDAFVAAFNGNGAVLFSTYLGGLEDDSARGVAVDTSGDIWLTGWTLSTDFPILDAFQESNNGSEDIFFTKFDPGDLSTYTPDLGDMGPINSTTTSTTGSSTTQQTTTATSTTMKSTTSTSTTVQPTTTPTIPSVQDVDLMMTLAITIAIGGMVIAIVTIVYLKRKS
jgi:hypothetical protein